SLRRCSDPREYYYTTMAGASITIAITRGNTSMRRLSKVNSRLLSCQKASGAIPIKGVICSS
ncbi:MAG: hypothetical protein VX554_00465, partial [Candidatus Thermoplasmatota archaeon]|nr:hypothetical protein [Candidatus Thermoplasmatota archaeon]